MELVVEEAQACYSFEARRDKRKLEVEMINFVRLPLMESILLWRAAFLGTSCP
jgi:hypothetical protein